YPKDRALGTAISTIGEFLLEDDMMVYLVVYDKQAFKLSEKLFSSIKEYIDDRYIEERSPRKAGRREAYRLEEGYFVGEISYYNEAVSPRKHKRDLADVVNDVDESFSEMLLRLIDEQGRNDSEVYKSANIDRRLFSKIRNDVDYKPSKPTAIAFAIALELSLDETKDLWLRAGYALSPSNKFDLIIEYFIENKIYNIFEVNEALFAFDQKLLGV
ncbi:MAG: RNase III inhibitor, partial [Tissierellia bacterium]|nr:RNase III inhibitor [Tissierellia bacterium]